MFSPYVVEWRNLTDEQKLNELHKWALGADQKITHLYSMVQELHERLRVIERKPKE